MPLRPPILFRPSKIFRWIHLLLLRRKRRCLFRTNCKGNHALLYLNQKTNEKERMSVVLLLYLTMLLWLVLQFCELYVCHPISNTILHLKMHSTSQLGMHWTVTAYIFEPLYWMNLGEMSTVVAVLFQIYQKYYDAIFYCRRHTCWQSQTIRYETSQSLQNTRCWMFYAYVTTSTMMVITKQYNTMQYHTERW